MIGFGFFFRLHFINSVDFLNLQKFLVAKVGGGKFSCAESKIDFRSFHGWTRGIDLWVKIGKIWFLFVFFPISNYDLKLY